MTERIQPSNNSLARWHSLIGFQATVSACLQSLSNTSQSVDGYLEDILDLNISKELKTKLTKTIRVNNRNQQLLNRLYLLTLKNTIQARSLHIEELLLTIQSQSYGLQFSTHKTYHSSLIVVDDEIFCSSIETILYVITSTKRFNSSFRRRQQTLVVMLEGKKNNWLMSNAKIVQDYYRRPVPQRGYDLEELIIVYALSLLESMKVTVHVGNKNLNHRLYIHLPISQQLNVFESTRAKE